MKNNTQERFEELFKEFGQKINKSEVKYEDALQLEAYAENLYLRYQEIIKSRDNWKEKYQKLKEMTK